jgi:signal transduction histidine kinase
VRRIPWQLLVGAALVVLLAMLATLQYRWLGDVSEAERERMRVGLRTRASDFTAAFDAELTRMYVAFHVDGEQLYADPTATLSDAYARWVAGATVPSLVRALYFFEASDVNASTVRRFDPRRRVIEKTAWPPELRDWRERVARAGAPASDRVASLVMADPVDATLPGLVVVVPRVPRVPTGGGVAVVGNPAALARAVVIVLDEERLRRELLEPLAAKHFGAPAESAAVVTVVRRDEPSRVVYSTADPGVGDAVAGDVTAGLFDLRLDELNRLATRAPGGGPHMAITIVRRARGPEGKRALMTGGEGEGAWLARVRYRSGSLESIVAKSRRRNLGISLGVLGLLAASFVLVVASAQRQRVLARQQMEFVAAVSHELRTPLAVIRSASENLADGVIADRDHVKRYGSLIRTEGRRLSDMVERVMEFAGIGSGASIRPRPGVDISEVILAAIDGAAVEARDRGIRVDVHTNGSLPPIVADADALRAAVRNIVGNAVKYSADGATVDVAAEPRGEGVHISVADRGMGIDPDDLPHIFEPFYRGRRAVNAQVRGTGVGLSVVRQVIRAHHGEVAVESRAGGGTIVNVTLPMLHLKERPAPRFGT